MEIIAPIVVWTPCQSDSLAAVYVAIYVANLASRNSPLGDIPVSHTPVTAQQWYVVWGYPLGKEINIDNDTPSGEAAPLLWKRALYCYDLATPGELIIPYQRCRPVLLPLKSTSRCIHTVEIKNSCPTTRFARIKRSELGTPESLTLDVDV